VPFRDDREALRQRVDSLERDLADERDQHEEAQAARARLAAELEAARRELDRLRPPPPDAAPRRSRLWMAIPLLVIASIMTATLGASRRRSVPAPVDLHPVGPQQDWVAGPVHRLPGDPGSESTPETRAAIQAARSSLDECLPPAGAPSGRLLAHVRFGVDGGVTHLTIDVVEGDLGRVVPCVDDTLRGMSIAPPGRVLDIDVPFVFAGAP
jgi:hypothetical protein